MESKIQFQNMSLDFPIYGMHNRSLKKAILKLSTGGIIKKGTDDDFVVVQALDDINLTIQHGDRVGLIGHNGAGKSTILRVMAGIYEPSIGTCTVKGSVTPLLNLMCGINGESTGYENIRARYILQGVNKKDIPELTEKAAEFSELGSFLNVPIRTYSSGMQLRLAFSIVMSLDPQILLLDEVIGAGDQNFMKKAKQKISEVIDSSDIVVLASHNSHSIRDICNKVLWLESGKIKFFGDVQEGVKMYEASL